MSDRPDTPAPALGPASPPLPTLHRILSRLHWRLALFAVMLAGLSLTATGAMVIRDYAGRNLGLVAKTVAYTVEPAILFRDAGAMRTGIATVAGGEGVRAVEVRSNSGALLLHWQRADAGTQGGLADVAGRLLWPHPAVALVGPAERRIGEVRVFGDARGIGGYVLSGALIALLCLALTAIATHLLARRLQRAVTQPLGDIARITHAVRAERDFERRVPPSGIAEIHRLGQDFNALLAELHTWHRAITSENRALVQQANHDGLTALGNRTMFEQRLAEAVDGARAQGEGFALLYLDANRFKQVNDRYGHDAGDVMLAVIAARLRVSIRPGDHAFRLGGDEFAILIAPGSGRAEVAAVVDRINSHMTQPIMLPSGDSIAASLSIGQALFPDDGDDPRDLVRQADLAMYAVKQGRSRSGSLADSPGADPIP